MVDLMWVKKWVKKYNENNKTINPNAAEIIYERVDYLTERWNIVDNSPWALCSLLDSIFKKYNGLLYEEDGIMMEIDLFNEPIEEEQYLFGIGNSKVFIQFLYDYHSELLI